MTSTDLERFYNLVYVKGFRISNFSVEFARDTGSKAEVELFKDDNKIVFKSDEEDLDHTLLRFQKQVDPDGSVRLAKIKNSKKYFEAIKEFVEHRETKLSKALEDWKKGKTSLEGGFWHKVDQALVKLLFEKTSRDDSDILWLRANYFHIFTFYLTETKGITGGPQKELFHKHKDIQPLAAIAERIFTGAFLSNKGSRNPVQIYKAYRQYLPDSLEDQTERVSIQLAYLDDLGKMMKIAGSQKKSIRILYVLDVYRRVYEMTLPILKLLRNALLLTNEGTGFQIDVSADEIITMMRDNNCGVFVEAFNPQIRHCESHLATRIREDKGIVSLTDRKGHRRISIQEFSFEEIVSYQQRLYNVVFPALFYASENFDSFMKIMLMHSFEYQLLLISKTTA